MADDPRTTLHPNRTMSLASHTSKDAKPNGPPTLPRCCSAQLPLRSHHQVGEHLRHRAVDKIQRRPQRPRHQRLADKPPRKPCLISADNTTPHVLSTESHVAGTRSAVTSTSPRRPGPRTLARSGSNRLPFPGSVPDFPLKLGLVGAWVGCFGTIA